MPIYPRTTSLTAAVLLIWGRALAVDAPQIRPGVWAAPQPEALPLPVQGYEAFLVGEMHGLQENVAFQLKYLEHLHHTSGLRDIAIEERGVYEGDAQAYVDGRSGVLPPSLCLRAALLDGIRRLNATLSVEERIRVHFTDIDSPASAIRLHLSMLQRRLGADGIRVPPESGIPKHGIETVAQLRRMNPDSTAQSELRTVELSIRSLQDGLEFDVGQFKGVPYLDSREEAVAANIADLLRLRGVASLLVVYGSDHTSRAERRNFAGPRRDQLYTPMALRLQRAGIKGFSLLTLPLEGEAFWRGRTVPTYWTPEDAHLSTGETLDRVVAAAPDARSFFVDLQRERIRLPGEDLNRMTVDAVLLFRSGTPMAERCATPAAHR
jgi:hypothetical protein